MWFYKPLQPNLTDVKKQNEMLLSENDSISQVNNNLDKRITEIDIKIKSKSLTLDTIDNKMKVNKNNYSIIHNYVNDLDMYAVDSLLTNYLENRK